jgi:catechol 2,3-dioxygenase-like lactoylglutathione lyase family enzyme
MFRIVPQLSVTDIRRSVRFYVERLGFAVSVEDPPGDPSFVSLEREEAALFLVSDAARDDPFSPAGGAGWRGTGIRLYFEVDDAAELHAALRRGGVEGLGELTFNEEEQYTEFRLRDPDGYELGVYS